MDSSKLYEADFPTQHKVQDIDIVTLYHGERFDELDSVIVCKSREELLQQHLVKILGIASHFLGRNHTTI